MVVEQSAHYTTTQISYMHVLYIGYTPSCCYVSSVVIPVQNLGLYQSCSTSSTVIPALCMCLFCGWLYQYHRFCAYTNSVLIPFMCMYVVHVSIISVDIPVSVSYTSSVVLPVRCI